MSARAAGVLYRPDAIPMAGVREHVEGHAVELDFHRDRWVVAAFNEGGHDSTAVDLAELVRWLREHKYLDGAFLRCSECAKDPDPRGRSACAACRSLNEGGAS